VFEADQKQVKAAECAALQTLRDFVYRWLDRTARSVWSARHSRAFKTPNAKHLPGQLFILKSKAAALIRCPLVVTVTAFVCHGKVLPEAGHSPTPRFEIGIAEWLSPAPQDGRLFVVLNPTNSPEPRHTLGRTGADAPWVLAKDIKALKPGDLARLDERAFAFPKTNPPPGEYYVQALFDCSNDIRSLTISGNLYSLPQKLHPGTNRIELTQRIPDEQLPEPAPLVRFVNLRSKLLSKFHHHPMFIRAGVILPRDYGKDPSQRYPLWIRIGGLNTRYTAANRLMEAGSAFSKTWLAADTPRFILLQLDGAGPYGDPYYINSANNGPYGDALVKELIPYIEKQYRSIGKPRARVLSGVSTGGWVSLAIQIFYPDFFNGAWASCPDPVDFRALERMNIYSDKNAYADSIGRERPSERNLKGEVTLTVRREVGVENLLGRHNSYTLSGQQWGAWNAAFGQRGQNGLPVPLWDVQSGQIDHRVAEQWRKYDLRAVLEQNWNRLEPKLRGKLHIASGEADQFYLNEAAHLLDAFLSKANPPWKGTITYGPGKGHGWSNLSLKEMLVQMQAAVKR